LKIGFNGRYSFANVLLGIFILFERNTVLDSAKNVLMPLEPKLLLVMCERIGEALEIMYDVLYTFQHQ
jgi:hypothetical protein